MWNRWALVLVVALAVAPSARAAQKAVSPQFQQDRAFLIEAAQRGLVDFELGQLAEERGATPDIQLFGKRLMIDELEARNEIRRLAMMKGVSLPSTVGGADQAVQQRLAFLSGVTFDRVCIETIIADHAEELESFQDESRNGHDQDVRQFATDTVPILERRLQFAQWAQREMTTTPRP